jgi:hypothetical protein
MARQGRAGKDALCKDHGSTPLTMAKISWSFRKSCGKIRLADHTFLFLLLTPFEFPPSEGGKKGGRLICFNTALEPVVQCIVDAASLKQQFHEDP